MSPLIGRIYDAYGSNVSLHVIDTYTVLMEGKQVLLPVGSFITVLSMMLLSLCKANHAYQFFLCQGIFFGIGNALVFVLCFIDMSRWCLSFSSTVLLQL